MCTDLDGIARVIPHLHRSRLGTICMPREHRTKNAVSTLKRLFTYACTMKGKANGYDGLSGDNERLHVACTQALLRPMRQRQRQVCSLLNHH